MKCRTMAFILTWTLENSVCARPSPPIAVPEGGSVGHVPSTPTVKGHSETQSSVALRTISLGEMRTGKCLGSPAGAARDEATERGNNWKTNKAILVVLEAGRKNIIRVSSFRAAAVELHLLGGWEQK